MDSKQAPSLRDRCTCRPFPVLHCAVPTLLPWILGAQVDLEPTLDLVGILELVLDWESSNRLELALIFKVDPVGVVSSRHEYSDITEHIFGCPGVFLGVIPEDNEITRP
eukprot:scaffold22679_cov146-Cylindrotheca_fusiformis.AAC.2